MNRNEVYFPYVDTSASDEARRANKAANENRERLAGIEAEQQRHFSSQGDAIQSLRNSIGSISRVIGDLEHRIEVLFKKDEKQTINVQVLQGQTSELASVVVDLAARLEESQEVQKEVIECLVQMKEALVAISEHVAAMEAGGREVMDLVEGILAEGVEGGLQEGKEGTVVGLPHTTVEFMKAVDVLCIEFRAYDNEAVRDFDFSTTPPQVKSDRKDNLEASSLREKRYQFAEMFHGNITEKMFRDFCLSIGGQNFIESHRIFYHELTKPLYNPTIKMICESIIQHQHIAQQHESVEHHAGV